MPRFTNVDPLVGHVMFDLPTFEVVPPTSVCWCPRCYWFSGVVGDVMIVVPGNKPEKMAEYRICKDCGAPLSEIGWDFQVLSFWPG
jgi:hypothetical protein